MVHANSLEEEPRKKRLGEVESDEESPLKKERAISESEGETIFECLNCSG